MSRHHLHQPPRVIVRCEVCEQGCDCYFDHCCSTVCHNPDCSNYGQGRRDSFVRFFGTRGQPPRAEHTWGIRFGSPHRCHWLLDEPLCDGCTVQTRSVGSELEVRCWADGAQMWVVRLMAYPPQRR